MTNASAAAATRTSAGPSSLSSRRRLRNSKCRSRRSSARSTDVANDWACPSKPGLLDDAATLPSAALSVQGHFRLFTPAVGVSGTRTPTAGVKSRFWVTNEVVWRSLLVRIWRDEDGLKVRFVAVDASTDDEPSVETSAD